jgi:hypothetical protein
MFAGIGELAAQKFGLDPQCLLKIGRVNQLAGMLECCPHVLLGERQRLFGNFRARTGHRRHGLAGGIEEHAECLFRLVDGFLGQFAQLGRDFEFRFSHGRFSTVDVERLA